MLAKLKTTLQSQIVAKHHPRAAGIRSVGPVVPRVRRFGGNPHTGWLGRAADFSVRKIAGAGVLVRGSRSLGIDGRKSVSIFYGAARWAPLSREIRGTR